MIIAATSHHPETHLHGDHRRLACAGSKFNRKSSFASPPPVRVSGYVARDGYPGHHLSMKHVSNVEYWICLCFLQYTCIYIYMCVCIYKYIYIYIFTYLFSLLLHSATPCAPYSQLRSATIFRVGSKSFALAKYFVSETLRWAAKLGKSMTIHHRLRKGCAVSQPYHGHNTTDPSLPTELAKGLDVHMDLYKGAQLMAQLIHLWDFKSNSMPPLIITHWASDLYQEFATTSNWLLASTSNWEPNL